MLYKHKLIFVFVLIFSISHIYAQSYITVDLYINQFKSNTCSDGPFDNGNEWRIRHRINSDGAMSNTLHGDRNCNDNVNWNNFDSGNMRSRTVPGNFFSHQIESWEEDCGDENSYNGCCDQFLGQCISQDELDRTFYQQVNMEGFASGTWIQLYLSQENREFKSYFRWTTPKPATPAQNMGINIICGLTPVAVSTSSDLPSDFIASDISYQWYINYDNENPNSTFSVYNGLTQSSGNITMDNVPVKRQIGLMVRTSYKGGDWGPFSAVGHFDMYPAPPSVAQVIPHPARCNGDSTGYIELKSVSGFAGGSYTVSIDDRAYTGVNSRKVPAKTYFGQTTSDFPIPNLNAYDKYIVYIKNGNGDTSSFGECHIAITEDTKVRISEPEFLPTITSASANPINGTEYNVSCVGNTLNNYLPNGSISIIAQFNSGTLIPNSLGYKYWGREIFTNNTTSKQLGGLIGLPNGKYEIYIEDDNQCSNKYLFEIEIRKPTNDITATAKNNLTNNFAIACHGESTGNILAQVNDRQNVGTVKYELLNSANTVIQSTTDLPNNSSHNFLSLPIGTYKVKVTDALGCTNTVSDNTTTSGFTLAQPPKLTIAGILKPRQFDSNEITNAFPSNALVMSFNGFDFQCNNTQNGYVKILAQGGVPNYIYQPVSGLTQNNNADFYYRNLNQNTPYTFTVEDANYCTVSSSITLDSIPAPLQVQSLTESLYNGFNVSCNELNYKSLNDTLGSNGIVTIIGIGGVYFKKFDITHENSFVYYNGSSHNTTLAGNFHSKVFNNLSWNSHDFKIQDANQCVLTGNFFLEQPSELSVSGVTMIEPNCHHYRDGLFTITLAGSVPQYESVFQQRYGTQKHEGELRNPAFKTRTLTGTNLTIDSADVALYKMNIKDANGCTLIKDNIPMTEPDSLTVTTLVGYVPCKDGLNGKFITLAKGGTAPYAAWLDGTITGIGSPLITFTGLRDHTYAMNLTDAHGCYNYMKNNSIAGANVGSAIVSGPPAKLEFYNTTVTSPSCYGFNDGSITPTHIGGYLDDRYIRYSLDSINYSDISRLNYLSSGSYRIILEETNPGGLCIITTIIGMPEKQPLSVTGIARDIACFNEQNGMIILSATGGNGGYLYSVSGESLSSNGTFTGFDIGNYRATVKDKYNCPVNTLTFAIIEPALLVGNFNSHFSTCGEANGSITFSGTGGTQPYSFLPLTPEGEITNTQVLSTMHQVSSGLHSVELKDVHQCTTTITGLVNDLNGPTVSGMLIKPASCSYSSDGATKITIQALSASLYKTIWTGSDTVSKSLEANQLKGNTRYTALTEDIYGCKGGDTVWVPAPEMLRVAVTGATDPQCVNEANGKLSALASGGSAPYIYTWDDAQTQQTATATGLSAISDDTLRIKKYTVKTVDSHGCTATGIGSLTNPMGVVLTLTSYSGVICDGQVKELSAGKPLYTRGNTTYQWSDHNGIKSNTPKAMVSVAGAYTIAIKDSIGCGADTVFTLTTSRNLLKALYGASSNVSVGDTLVFVEYSWPAPDSVEYAIPSSFVIVTASGDQMYTTVVPQEEGTYEIFMKVALADCQDQLTKHIHVGAKTASGSNLRLGYEGITEASMYPNPAGQYTILSLTLTDEMPIAIQIRRAEGQDAVWQNTIDGKEKNEIRIDLSNFLSGVYVIYTSTENSVRVLKLTVVR